MSMDLWKECRELCKIARELCYSDKVISRLKQAKSICERINLKKEVIKCRKHIHEKAIMSMKNGSFSSEY